MKLSKLRKRAKKFNIEQVSTHRSKEYYAFQKELINICKQCYVKNNIKNVTLIYGTPIEAFAWRWLNSQKQFILNDNFAQKLVQTKIQNKAESKLNKLPNALSKRYAQNEIIAERNKKNMYRKFNIHVFNKPKDQTVHHISADRSEFSQYMNEPVHLLGKVKKMNKDIDVNGHIYTKILLVNVQYFPTNPKYMFKKALFLPDHIWIDITRTTANKITYQVDDYAAFSGIVGEYQSKVNHYKSESTHKIDYWRTKYNLMNPEYQDQGQPVIDENGMISELKLENRPEDMLNAKYIKVTKNLKGK